LKGNRPTIDDDCPHDLVEVITHCWAEDIHERPSFANIVKELTHVVENVKKTTPEGFQHVKTRDNPDMGSNGSPQNQSYPNGDIWEESKGPGTKSNESQESIEIPLMALE